MFKLQIDRTEEEGVFILSGVIAADIDFSPFLQSPQPLIILKFEDIREITSMGVKKWVEGLHKLRQSGKTVEYQDCPEIFIEQCSLVLEMAEGVKVHSFEVTFVCEDCDEGKTKMLKTEELDLKNLPPSISCPSCRETMITEDTEPFNFLIMK